MSGGVENGAEHGLGNGVGNGLDDELVAEDDGEDSDGEDGVMGTLGQGLGHGATGGGSVGMSLQVGERALDAADGEVAQSEHDAFRAYLVRSLGETLVDASLYIPLHEAPLTLVLI